MSFNDIITDLDPSQGQLTAETLNKILQILRKQSTPDLTSDVKKYIAAKSAEYDVHDTTGPKKLDSMNILDNEYLDNLNLAGYIRQPPEIVVPCPLVETLTDTGISFSTGINGDFSKKFGGGAKFNGSSYITIGDHSILNRTDKISITGWIYSPSGISSGDIIKKNNQYQLYISASNTLAWRIHSGGAWKTPVTMSLTPDSWNHFAVTYKSTSSGQKIYKNAVLANSDSETGAIATSSNTLGIANDGAGSSALPANTRLAWLSLLYSEFVLSDVEKHYGGFLDTRNHTEIVTYPFTVNAKYETDMHPGNWNPH